VTAHDWTERHIRKLPKAEYDELEFKSSPLVRLDTPEGREKLLDDLAKALSALANTDGGFLVLGVQDPKEARGPYLEIVQGGVPRVFGKTDTLEWLNSVIPNLLDYELKGFEVHPVTRRGRNSQIHADRAVFVIGVPASGTAPHKSRRDNIYYVRLGGNSLPASHRMLMDIVGRQQHPKLDVRFEIRLSDVKPPSYEVMLGSGRNEIASLRITGTNVGSVLAHYVNLVVLVPVGFYRSDGSRVPHGARTSIDGQDHFVLKFDNTRRDQVGSSPGISASIPRYGTSWFDPILPGCVRNWSDQVRPDIATYRHNLVKELQVRWRAHADNAPVAEGAVPIMEIPIRDLRQPSRT
jgi:hypothetical protein